MSVSNCNAVGARLLLAIALLVASIGLLSPSTDTSPPYFEHYDKLLHFSTFLVLALLADLGWPHRGFEPTKYLPLFAYGVLTEALQHFVPGRETSGWDLLADVIGIMVYGLLILPLLRWRAIR